MTAASVLDDKTTTAIREAMTAAGAGRVSEAVSIGERALAGGGDKAALNAMIGMLHCQTGSLDAGIRHLAAARQERPADPVISANLATALASTGDHGAALEVLTEEIAASDPTLRLRRMRAFLAQEARNLPISISAYEEIVAANPDDWESWNNLGNARRLFGDFDGSVSALERAIELSPDSPPIHLNLGMALAKVGKIDEAESALRKMAERFPEDARGLLELHAIFKELGREEDALDVVETAAAREPRNVQILLALGSQRLNLLKHEAAEEAYRGVIAIEPSNELANLGLAVVYELSNRADDLSRLIGEAEERGASDHALNFIRAMHLRREKRFDEGLAALETVPEELESGRRYHLLGQLCEGAGRYDEAFAAFTKMNQLQAKDLTRPEERAKAYRQNLRKQIEIVAPEWAQGWRQVAANDDRPSPVFLVGFPRSGTTLLDTMLMGHAGVEVLEEEPTLLDAVKLIGAFENLPAASDAQILAARDEYFRVAARHAPLAPGKLLIDKNPLSMNFVPVIKRLFPDARIILALRHPCDVVLSCYAANFKLNDGMSSFLKLDTTAELYDLSFRYFEKAQEVLGLPVHRVVYENVVADRERELKALVDFLGLDWDADVLDHEKTARGRGRIKTASYAQVAQPIYSQSAGRWTNYRKHLEPVLPVLQPWIAKFGYTV
jgi:tetratricopeptide (TPR) repeat protein